MPGPLAGLGEIPEELTEIIGARAGLVCEQTVEDPAEHMRREHLQVLGEEGPDELEDELRELLSIACAPLAEPLVQVSDERDCLAGQLGLAAGEIGLPVREEQQRVEVLRELGEFEGDPGRRVHGTRLPDLEAVEGAQYDVPRRGHLGRPGIAPVVEGLHAVLIEAPGLARPLHLDDADTRPEHVHESPGAGGVLEAGAHLLPVRAVAREELRQERLCF